ncbi:MAG: oxygenase MpaB family protein [bacterium]
MALDLAYHLLAPLNRKMNAALTGDADASPPWLTALADGDDAGYFGPGSAVWTVHGTKATVVAGLRALLMQVAHPSVAAGVAQHSAYQRDPLGRLSRTVEWLTVMTYGSRKQSDEASAGIRQRHVPVSGVVTRPDGRQGRYQALDQDLMRWVHNAFTESILTCHLTWESRHAVDADDYVREWATAGTALGLDDPPRSTAALLRQIEQARSSLAATEESRAVVETLRHPPLDSAVARDAYEVLLAGAEATLPDWIREIHGLRPLDPTVVWPPVAAMVDAMDTATGGRSPARRQADARLQRLGISSP